MREVIYEGHILRLELEDGRWEIVRHADAVAVLAQDERGRVLGVWQPRPAIAARTWELPAGLIDPGETPEGAAARELAEEAGVKGELRLLTRLYASPGFCDELIYLFEASNLRPAPGSSPDPSEDLELEWRDPLSAWQELRSGDLSSSGVTALGLRHALAEQGREPLAASTGRP